MNSSTKCALIFIPGHKNFQNRTICPGLWDTKMLVKAIELAIEVDVVDFSYTETKAIMENKLN